MRRSWYGEENVEEGERAVRFYDRLATPFPPLDGGEVDTRDEHLQEFRRVRKRWLDDIVKTRLVLQRDALVEEEVDEATVQELRARGFLGDGS